MEFQLQHQPSNKYSGLIPIRIDSFDLLAVQVTCKSLPQHHSSKISVLQLLDFFMVQLSHPYMLIVGKVISLILNMLSRLVIIFLPRSKRLLISWLQSPSAVILEPKKIKSDSVSPYICHEVMGPDAINTDHVHRHGVLFRRNRDNRT